MLRAGKYSQTPEEARDARRYCSRKGKGPTGKFGAPCYVTARFNLPGSVRFESWQHLKAPPGWRKNPRKRNWEHSFSVSFRCVDPTAIANMTPEWVEEMKLKLLLIVRNA